MFTINIKRSVGALVVTAGLLAAAGPASAQIGPASMSFATSAVFELNTVRAGAPVLDINATVIVPDGELSLLKMASRPDGDTVGGNKTLKADSNEVAVEGITLAHAGWRPPVDDMDLSIRGHAQDT